MHHQTVLLFFFYSLISCYQHQLHQYKIPRLHLPFTDEPRYYAAVAAAPTKQKTIPLCEYWKILGVYREECQEDEILMDDYQSNKQQESYESKLIIII